jgi:hypothetical protein
MKLKIFVCALLSTWVFFSNCKKDNVQSPTVQEYLDYRLDGINYHFEPIADTITATKQLYFPNDGSVLMYISCARWNLTPPGGLILTCHAPSVAAGTYPSSQPCVVWNGVSGLTIPPNAIQVTLSSFGANVGDYFEGTFTGTFNDQGITHTLNGSFYVKRNI